MAWLFDAASNEYIDFGNPSYFDITGDLTLSIWGKPNDTGAERKLFAKWADAGGQFSYLLSILSDGTLQGVINTGANDVVNGTTDLDDGEYHHLAFTYDGSNLLLYVDGIEEDSVGASGSITSTTAPVRIGAGSGGLGTEQPYDGEAGHGAIWDAALTPSEIASLAKGVNPLLIRRGSLKSYPPLNGQSPEYDVVGGASGIVTGAVVVGEPPIPHSIVAPG